MCILGVLTPPSSKQVQVTNYAANIVQIESKVSLQ